MSDSELDREREGTQPTAGGDDVARLVAVAGPRPAVPADVAARVKAAAHAHWRRRVAARSGSRRTSMAAFAAVAVVVLGAGAVLWHALCE